MAGHSHWAGIKHKKGRMDKKKAKAFSKAAKQLMVAAKEGGSDPDANYKLQFAIEEAKAVNMPKDNIEYAIAKGAGELEGEQLVTFLFEGFGPGGVAVICEGLTDNRIRTKNELKTLFEKNKGKLAGAGAVSHMFHRKGLFTGAKDATDEDTMLTVALDAGAENAELAGSVWEITCAPNEFAQVRKGIADRFEVASAALTMLPTTTIKVDEEAGRNLLELMDVIDDQDDVNAVYVNAELPESLIAEATN